ncbi:NmrA family NAD(P)-binding protein [Agrobacterium rosae]|uniref:NmrA family NAD(P)-binding protein n=1 Tax=Agrobacterium rosae TaxID=1972867 RepID=UPI00122F505E|nr:NmrA family NAD(P)-binding protein [Agrobacterium rosae]KAA3508957.1 nucleoside-diphosphate sugar epimerase [Agrobacterium rosae]KAA3513532.1 nucleoside-diphosphate sugar epimerase [Agrobacterium rosae]MQB51094.1 nucleoside-diphosphate sugar epimerase [Agrobacterium rosae]
MRISVVGATGRVGAKLTRTLLSAGHQVRALSRGGPTLDALVELGAEPFLGSFDTGEGDLDQFFQGADAAFLMVKTDWNNIEGHYPAVAQRFVDALEKSSVKLAVSLTAMGSDVKGKTGHFECFHDLDQKLNELDNINLVHMRAAWFMEDVAAWTGPVAKYGRIAWFCKPDLKMPWVATDDIAWLAAKELTNPTSRHRVTHEVGSEDVSMKELAGIIGKEIGRPVEYRYIETTNEDVKAEFLARFGTLEKWQDDTLSADALNNGIVRFHGQHEDRPKLPTTMEAFIGDVWNTRYLKAVQAGDQPETFFMWTAKD